MSSKSSTESTSDSRTGRNRSRSVARMLMVFSFGCIPHPHSGQAVRDTVYQRWPGMRRRLRSPRAASRPRVPPGCSIAACPCRTGGSRHCRSPARSTASRRSLRSPAAGRELSLQLLVNLLAHGVQLPTARARSNDEVVEMRCLRACVQDVNVLAPVVDRRARRGRAKSRLRREAARLAGFFLCSRDSHYASFEKNRWFVSAAPF